MSDNASDNSPKTIVLDTTPQKNSSFDLYFDLDALQLDGLESDYLPDTNQTTLASTSSTTTESSSTRFHLKLFGSPRLYYLNNHIKLGTRKSMALLSYLAIRRAPVQRHELDALLWPVVCVTKFHAPIEQLVKK